MSRLEHIPTDELLAEIGCRMALPGRRDGMPAPACRCGPLRREIIEPGAGVAYDRTGCITCNTWDGPVRMLP